MESVDFVAETYPFVDVERMGVAGGSYGGFMTNWVIGHTDRFKAAISMRGTWTDLPKVKSMKTPLMIIHSELDRIEKAEKLFVALKKQKKVVEFVRFPGENHQLSRDGGPKHRVERLQHIVRWFDRYLR
jgi:acylaminoacyl-peptidase